MWIRIKTMVINLDNVRMINFLKDNKSIEIYYISDETSHEYGLYEEYEIIKNEILKKTGGE